MSFAHRAKPALPQMENLLFMKQDAELEQGKPE